MKCGIVSIIGVPNVGKSSLINALLGTPAVIISPKPQTTRNSVRCIYKDDDAQIILQSNGFYFLSTNPRTLAYKTFAGKNLVLLNKTQIFSEVERQNFLERWVKYIRFGLQQAKEQTKF